jgi:hypothetical protein
MNEDSRVYVGVIGVVLAIAAGACAIIQFASRHDQACYDKGLIWVPTIEGHWELPKQPAEKEKQ